jgi:hypothetical protein
MGMRGFDVTGSMRKYQSSIRLHSHTDGRVVGRETVQEWTSLKAQIAAMSH